MKRNVRNSGSNSRYFENNRVIDYAPPLQFDNNRFAVKFNINLPQILTLAPLEQYAAEKDVSKRLPLSSASEEAANNRK